MLRLPRPVDKARSSFRRETSGIFEEDRCRFSGKISLRAPAPCSWIELDKIRLDRRVVESFGVQNALVKSDAASSSRFHLFVPAC